MTDTKGSAPQHTAQELAPPTRYEQLGFVTIDNQSTRDIDDAVWMARDGDNVHIVIAIADPTGLVAIGSTEDASARLLGSTIYIRDQAVRKMLPPRISEEEGSLVAGRRRKSFVMDITLDKNLEVSAFELHRSMIKVVHRLSYEDIPLILQQENNDLRPLVGLAAQVGRMLLQKRRQAGALALYDLARLLLTDEEGRLMQLTRADEMVGHIIVQELMVLTNTLMSAYMLAHSIPGIFRNHEPSSAAPPSDELAKTIENWMQSAALDAEKVQAQFALIIGKAHYSAHAKGHFALAIGVYGHFTSPLRRYADLVNLRQVRAFIKGLPPPYDTQQLNELSNELNEAMERRKQERSQGFKDVVERTAVRALQQHKLTHLADHELSKAVKLAREAGELPEILSSELIRRLDGEISTDKLTDTLVMELPKELWTEALKEVFLSWLLQSPTRSIHIVNHGAQTGAFGDMAITSAGQGTTFSAQVQFHIGGRLVQAAGTGARKKEAEQDAATRAVANFLGLTLSSKAQTIQQPAEPVMGNSKGALLELCQKRGLNVPVFDGSNKGPSHAMVFSATASVMVDDKPYSASVSGCANKKEAEARASQALLEQLANVKIDATPALAGALVNASQHPNPVGALMEMAQKGKFTPPEFVVTELQAVPPKFQCVASVNIGGQRRTFTSTTNTKQDAKKLSAAMALKVCITEKH